MNITLRVNGTDRQLDVDPEMPLLWALRDVIGLTGTKYGCGEALCGACTVHLDGQVVRSCVTPVRRAVNAEVMTIEGLSPDGTHPLQKAWVELGVPQCGFCQAGQLMTAAALLTKNAEADRRRRSTSRMAGNLCRCGTYARIRAAIKKAAGVGRVSVGPVLIPRRSFLAGLRPDGRRCRAGLLLSGGRATTHERAGQAAGAQAGHRLAGH